MKWSDVIQFWFKETKPEQWFKKDKKFDAAIRRRFLDMYWRVVKGETAEWRKTAKGRLAEVIVLDQFSRNMFRGLPQAFAYDPLALALAAEAIRTGADKTLKPEERRFLYMPFMHSESKKLQKESVRLFGKLGGATAVAYAKDHKQIVDRFGRFPQRNAILGRRTTMAEKKFLKAHKGY